MVKKIMHDPLFLAQKSVDATEADKQIVTDLLDTLRANLEHCVGMAANMIGVKKNIIVVAAGPFQFAMINPVITKKSGAYQASPCTPPSWQRRSSSYSASSSPWRSARC